MSISDHLDHRTTHFLMKTLVFFLKKNKLLVCVLASNEIQYDYMHITCLIGACARVSCQKPDLVVAPMRYNVVVGSC